MKADFVSMNYASETPSVRRWRLPGESAAPFSQLHAVTVARLPVYALFLQVTALVLFGFLDFTHVGGYR